MSLPIPQLDDRRFKELVPFLRDRIPGHTREWTDFNPSDPGMTLLELWCWLAEMILYRINQIPEKNVTNFFKLILDAPEPVTAEVTLELFPQINAIPIAIPPGIRFKSLALSPPVSLIFETFSPTVLPMITLGSPPEFESPPEFPTVSFPVRSRVLVEDEELGVSDGGPDQIFYLKQGPVLTDESNTGSGPGVYNPNPRITVDGDLWEYVPDFLESTTGPNSTQFMVEHLTGGIRFGNGVKGRIPLAGAQIVAVRYQIIRGKEVRIGQDTLELLDPIPELPFSEIIAIKNQPAEGGLYIYPFEEARTTGLKSFKEEFRAITAEDFTEIASTQFNQAQESIPVPPGPADLVERVVVVPDKKLEGTAPFPQQPGVVSVIILPKPQSADEVELQPTAELRRKVSRFLERRRLITTRAFVVGPDYVPLSLETQVTAEPRTNTEQVEKEIKKRIRQFFHPLEGGDQGTGWPIGRDVYKSELFQLIESVEGVDHANKIVMSGNVSLNKIILAENQLPLIEDITIAF